MSSEVVLNIDGKEVARHTVVDPTSEALRGLMELVSRVPPSNFLDVGLFHRKFNLDESFTNPTPRHITPELQDFRLKFLREELDELEAGYVAQDLAKIADALVDLVYVALGTAHLHGLPWEALFDEVQRANMAKERAQRAEDSTRGSSFDVIKPKGWTPPSIEKVLHEHGWAQDERTSEV